jgi:hypothetical protein
MMAGTFEKTIVDGYIGIRHPEDLPSGIRKIFVQNCYGSGGMTYFFTAQPMGSGSTWIYIRNPDGSYATGKVIVYVLAIY